MVIGIIGGGASGMAAALAASRNPQNEIHIFERQARLGKKLSATGNGRCNLSNLIPAPYFGDDPDFSAPALGKFPPEEIGRILEEGNRTAAGPTVPAGGLYMTHLWYDDGVEKFECPD